jgi:predicted CoA-binding protein
LKENVVILGASPRPDRYSNKAIHSILQHGHTPIPINPKYENIEGLLCFSDLRKLKEHMNTSSESDEQKQIHTICLYLNPSLLKEHVKSIIDIKPKRVIFNPGTEDDEVAIRLEQNNIEALFACTLVLLATHQF